MSSETLELVRHTLKRFQEGDRDYWRSVFDEDVVFDMSADSALFGTYHGHQGLEEFFRKWLGSWEDYAVEHRDFVDAGDSVVVSFRQRGRGRGSGVEIDREFHGVYDVADRKIVRYRGFASREEALRAAGLEKLEGPP